MIELRFPVTGTYFPADQNYRLYAALIHQNQRLKSVDWQLGTITGHRQYDGLIKVDSKSILSIRCNFDDVENFTDTDRISIKDWTIAVGTPSIHKLNPSLSLQSRLVTIKGAETESQFIRSLLLQARLLEINGAFGITSRQVLKIKSFTIVGWKVFAELMSEKDSLILQSKGIGGKRKMGCGVFYA
jgi:CRISPR-associated endonuclease/helicase Cas3